MIHRGCSRCVITAERECHDTDTLWIEFGARGQIVVGGTGVALGFVMQHKVTKAPRLAVARAVKNQTGNTARGEIRNALEVLDLLGHIEAIEKHHHRPPAAAAR